MAESVTHYLIPGRTYAVTPSTDCTISTANGIVITTVPQGRQGFFVAPESTILASDPACHITETFKGASVAVAGGGENGGTAVEQSFSPASAAAMSGVAVQEGIGRGWGGATVHDYGVLESDLDLSAFTLTEAGRTAATDEIWLAFAGSACEVVWPGHWIWCDGEAPGFSPDTAYCITVRHERMGRTCACLAYSYPLNEN